jgi:hypothetical protein
MLRTKAIHLRDQVAYPNTMLRPEAGLEPIVSVSLNTIANTKGFAHLKAAH